MEHEIAAICRHFDSNLRPEGGRKSSGGRNASGQAKDGEVPSSPGSDATVSYSAFKAWVDPVDVVRVSKR